jgi:GNAT superfamily N-acetyltransferase
MKKLKNKNNEIKVVLARTDSRYLEDVRQLADDNIKTLSFQPYSFFKKYAQDPGILVATVDKKFCGYLIWSINPKKSHARVWQLCIAPEYRGNGIARALNSEMVDRTKDKVRSVYLECKANYGIDNMWRKLGYVPTHEKDAKTPGDVLKRWSIRYNSIPSIFDPDSFMRDYKTKSAIDAATLYQLNQERKSRQAESLSIDWIRYNLGVCVTDEIFNEIDKNYEGNDRQILRSIVGDNFANQECDLQNFNKNLKKLQDFLTISNIDLDDVCIRHIARCAATDIPYLITSQDKLSSLQDEFYVNFGVRLVSLQDMINLQEETTNQLNYQPYRLINSSIKRSDLSSWDLNQLVPSVQKISSPQNKNNLLMELRSYVKNKDTFKSIVLSIDDLPSILVVYDLSKLDDKIIEIPIFRILKDVRISDTLANYIIHEILKKTIDNNSDFLIVTDENLEKSEEKILRNQYFIKKNNFSQWIKCCRRGVFNSQGIIDFLSNLSNEVKEYHEVSGMITSTLRVEDNLIDSIPTIDIERLLWPLKIENSKIDNFIVPIKPEAAKELFDDRLAQENLFGVNKSSLFFSLESVYYRTPYANGGLTRSPSRILWYVSQSKDGGYSNLSSIRACSQVDDVIVDEPEHLHKKFQHLGFYNLPQIKKCASPKGKVMAIKFSHTELFDTTVSLKLVKKYLNSKAPIQAPIKISNDNFIRLYRLGFQS